jgi:DNA-binding transcriptional MerR regulator
MLSSAQKSAEAFRTISEVAADLDVPQHVLRFWESKFGAVRPLKRGGGRRYYRPEDLDLLRGIRSLLYGDGLTIKGVQKILREQGARYVMELGRNATGLLTSPRAAMVLRPAREEPKDAPVSNVHPFRREPAPVSAPEPDRAHFATLLDELLELKGRLQSVRRQAAGR